MLIAIAIHGNIFFGEDPEECRTNKFKVERNMNAFLADSFKWFSLDLRRLLLPFKNSRTPFLQKIFEQVPGSNF